MTVLFKDSKEVLIAKAEVGKGSIFGEAIRGNGRWRCLKLTPQKALAVTIRTWPFSLSQNVIGERFRQMS